MSNQTLQKVLNTGYEIIQSQTVSPGGSTVQIPQAAGTNKIIVGITTRATGYSYIVRSGGTTEGIPLAYRMDVYDGGGLSPIFIAFPPIEILTSTPDEYYLYGNDNINVVYLAEIV